MTDSAVQKPSALATLKALASKKPVPQDAAISAQVDDPAISGAKRNKNTVTLGFDPKFADNAASCSELQKAMKDAEAAFKIYQARVREYGSQKREVYNDTFKSNVTTVCVPYFVDGEDAREERLIQVVCSNRYSVAQDTVLGKKEEMGDWYDKLFTEDVTRVVRPNAEELLRGLLQEVGIEADAVDGIMDQLLETKTKVSTKPEYETLSKEAPESLKNVLDQAVKRAEPGLKFPNN